MLDNYLHLNAMVSLILINFVDISFCAFFIPTNAFLKNLKIVFLWTSSAYFLVFLKTDAVKIMTKQSFDFFLEIMSSRTLWKKRAKWNFLCSFSQEFIMKGARKGLIYSLDPNLLLMLFTDYFKSKKADISRKSTLKAYVLHQK